MSLCSSESTKYKLCKLCKLVYATVDSVEFKTRTLMHGAVLLYIVMGQRAPG